jgi:Mg2+ and Co2+ transporter CorA
MAANLRPRVAARESYLFVALRWAEYDDHVWIGGLSYHAIAMFAGQDFVVTILLTPARPIRSLFEQCRSDRSLRESLCSSGPGSLLGRLVSDIVDCVHPVLNSISEEIDDLETRLLSTEAEALDNVSEALLHYTATVDAMEKVPRPRLSPQTTRGTRIKTLVGTAAALIGLVTGILALTDRLF